MAFWSWRSYTAHMSQQLFQVLASATTEEEGLLVAICLAHGAQGAEVHNAQTHTLEEHQIRVAAWYGSRVIAQNVCDEIADRSAATTTIQVTEATVAGWASTLVEAAPLSIGRQFVILSEPPPSTDRFSLYIRRGLGFGNGTHATTRLCVDVLETLFEREPFLRHFADLGTGTGVLAMVAARLGARSVIATEIDSVALAGAQQHVQLNELDDRIQLCEQLPAASGPFDCIMANLPPPDLMRAWHAAGPQLRAGGYAIISGFSDEQSTVIEDWLAHDDLFIVRSYALERWRAILAYRPN
ncbi:MAG: 50S ribosomal protein L11 methyltransferase [Myxococcota bacterium]|nr:50S ribosomal protein L11 methyltransferase [Myxococcota bacterium]